MNISDIERLPDMVHIQNHEPEVLGVDYDYEYNCADVDPKRNRFTLEISNNIDMLCQRALFNGDIGSPPTTVVAVYVSTADGRMFTTTRLLSTLTSLAVRFTAFNSSSEPVKSWNGQYKILSSSVFTNIKDHERSGIIQHVITLRKVSS